jgi:hypothetical protein
VRNRAAACRGRPGSGLQKPSVIFKIAENQNYEFKNR